LPHYGLNKVVLVLKGINKYLKGKIKMKFISAVSAIVLSVLAYCTSAFAHDYKIGNLVIDHPVIPATVKAAPVAAGYLKITNNGTEADRLVSISANFSAKQQIHTMTMIDGVMRMRPLKDGVEIPAGGEATLRSGGDHLMFMKLNEQMEAGQMRKVTLVFEKAGELEVEMIVVDMSDLGEAKEDHTDHSGHTN
jgi:copper(I)-binding protein